MNAQNFLEQPKKAITLIGMSGVGKSYVGQKLENWGWQNYSCDYLIGTSYLDAEMKETLSFETTVGQDNMAFLSAFVGKLGDAERDGLSLDEFKRRQNLYYEAERKSLIDMVDALENAEGHFVCDSSGSLCEIEDEAVLDAVGQRSLVVYLKVRQEGHGEILERAFKSPKPLYFPSAFLEERFARYLYKFDLKGVEEIDPVEFLRWVFPHLFESRLPKYQAIADRYGVTIGSGALGAVNSQDEFFELIAGALDV